MDETETRSELAPLADARFEPGLPPVLAGRATPAVERQVGSFYASVAEVFERWVARRDSKHTRRAYRQDVMAFVAALGLREAVERRLRHRREGSSGATRTVSLTARRRMSCLSANGAR